jgi:hypothetical protein
LRFADFSLILSLSQPSKALRGSVKVFASESEVSDLLTDALKVSHLSLLF